MDSGAAQVGGSARPGLPSRAPALDPRTIASATVEDEDGRRVGRVLDVYLVDRTGQLAAVSVALGPFADHDAVIPLDMLSPAAPGRVRVAASRDRVRTTAMAAPATAHLEPDALAAARRALAAEAAP
ncbi:PRC-barrel domain-containing protein [Brachybacterium huguangmaarense]|uniref:PRC-barrel domain-containing protein n=1 Tax=Brachybacterium huguangmaarense TaxID=1652028 RepID=A0ABY6G258_9MICO|nr:PRC-barrel domain-containing protein [Brachybacterium huguangmaarense]UYG17288.1 PRC-barrel domain-containing protein [Brachybacterium huguangmaarense]